MVEWLRQSTSGTLKLGPFVDETDAKTPETALTISQADVRLSKAGGDIAQKNDTTAATHDEGGWYDVPVNATDTGTLGRLLVSVQETGALPLWKEYMVVSQQAWDSLFSTDLLQVHAAEMSAGLITATVIATGAIDADALATDAVTEIQSGLSTFDSTTDPIILATATQASIDAIETDTNALNDTKISTTRADLLDNLVGIPASPAGASGGLATFDDVNAGVIFGTVDDTTPAVGNFTGNSALEDTTDDYYTGRFLIFTSNDLGARKISSYTASTRTFEFLGTPGTDADAPFDAAPVNGSAFIIFGFHGA